MSKAMRFVSTRGKEKVTGAEAIVQGLAKDGGLYVPEKFPKISAEEMEKIVKEHLPKVENKTEILILPLSMDEIGYAVAKRVGVLSVCDSGFSKKIKELTENGMQA